MLENKIISERAEKRDMQKMFESEHEQYTQENSTIREEQLNKERDLMSAIKLLDEKLDYERGQIKDANNKLQNKLRLEHDKNTKLGSLLHRFQKEKKVSKTQSRSTKNGAITQNVQ